MAEVTLSTAASKLGISRQALHKHIVQGHIPAKKVGKFYIVDDEQVAKDLEAYLNRPGQLYESKVSPKDKPSEHLQEPATESNAEVASPGE